MPAFCIKSIWASKDLETKRKLALNILDKCVKDSPAIVKIKSEIQNTPSALVIDKKITYLLKTRGRTMES